ncbi:MAG TPA: serine/threonine-protein kinase [Bacillales bacterium]|nr:serine/threonine-protein kinase [Bacillales bacterium]
MVQTRLKYEDTLMNRYRIVALLGAGGMSTVYLAKDLRANGRLYAVKESRMDPRWSKQLLIEAKFLGDLDHLYLPRIADLFLSRDQHYFYMVQDYISGVTLKQLFAQSEGYLPVEKVLKYALQTCEVLQYLHNQQIVYKDLKPANLMIDDKDEVKLIDFGISHQFGDGSIKGTLKMGTVGFAAPEQFQSPQADPRTDLFSLGAMMYFLLTGGNHVYTTEAFLLDENREVPRKLSKVIRSMVQIDPKERPASVREVFPHFEKLYKRLTKRRFFIR